MVPNTIITSTSFNEGLQFKTLSRKGMWRALSTTLKSLILWNLLLLVSSLLEENNRYLGSVGLRGSALIFNSYNTTASGTQLLLIPGTRRTKAQNSRKVNAKKKRTTAIKFTKKEKVQRLIREIETWPSDPEFIG